MKKIRMGRLARIHLRSKGKGQELRKNLSVSLKHIKKIVKERKRVDRLGRSTCALSVVKKAEDRERRLEMKMHRKKRKEYQVTQLAKPGRSSAAKKNTVKAVDKVLSAKIKNIPHPQNQSNCSIRSNQVNLAQVPSPILAPALAPVPAPAPAPPPLPAVQYLLYQQQAMHLGSKILLLSRCMDLKVYIYTWQRCLTSQRMKRKPI